MKGFKPEASFLGETARHYDDQLRGDEAETVQFLKDLAKGRDCLEFAIRTLVKRISYWFCRPDALDLR